MFVWLFLRHSTLAALDQNNSEPTMAVRDAVRFASYRASLASGFANGWAVFGLRISLVPLFVVEALHGSPAVAGISLSVFAVGNAAVLMLSGKLSDSIGRKPMAIAGLAVSAVGTVGMGFTGTVALFMVASLVAGVGAGCSTRRRTPWSPTSSARRPRAAPCSPRSRWSPTSAPSSGRCSRASSRTMVSYQAAFTVTGVVMLISIAFWFVAEETLPQQDDEHIGEAVAGECGHLDEGPEVPTGTRIGGRPSQPDA